MEFLERWNGTMRNAYAELLFRAGETLLLPFGYTAERLRGVITEKTQQVLLMQ